MTTHLIFKYILVYKGKLMGKSIVIDYSFKLEIGKLYFCLREGNFEWLKKIYIQKIYSRNDKFRVRESEIEHRTINILSQWKRK